MNLRTLKKLSKRAAPLLRALGDTREQFPAIRQDNYHGHLITARKHWERHQVRSDCEARNDYRDRRGAEIVYVTRRGRTVKIAPPSHPRKGTVMVGSVSGYYEPEWDEESAWGSLTNLVWWQCVDAKIYDEEDGWPRLKAGIILKSPADYLREARRIIDEGRKPFAIDT